MAAELLLGHVTIQKPFLLLPGLLEVVLCVPLGVLGLRYQISQFIHSSDLLGDRGLGVFRGHLLSGRIRVCALLGDPLRSAL